MKIAIPLNGERLTPHFGHCDKFALLDVDRSAKKILDRQDVDSPPHQPGFLPGWLHGLGVSMIISGGMGVRARELFARMGIEVLVGAPSDLPEALVVAWMEGTLVTGNNVCDH